MSGADPPGDGTTTQEGPTSIRVSWTVTPSSGATGYNISYTGGSSGSNQIHGSFTSTHLLTDLINGETYNVFILAFGQDFPSETVPLGSVDLGKFHLSPIVARSTTN